VAEAGGQNALARKAEMSVTAIGRLMRGGNPTLSTMIALAEASGRPLSWLAAGAEKSSALGQYQTIPRLDVIASAGPGAYLQENSDVLWEYQVPRQWFQGLTSPHSRLAMIEVRGDSMEPTLYDGDIVIVDMFQKDFERGGLYVLTRNNMVHVKRLQYLLDGSIRIISDNPKAQSETITKEQAEHFSVDGRVIWSGGPWR
jgi:phage repressor protein C with HTH and peptisase S24 domain